MIDRKWQKGPGTFSMSAIPPLGRNAMEKRSIETVSRLFQVKKLTKFFKTAIIKL